MITSSSPPNGSDMMKSDSFPQFGLSTKGCASVYLCNFHRKYLPQCVYGLLKALLPTEEKPQRFFSYTYYEDEVSVLVEQEYIDLLPKDLINVTGDKWRVLPVHMGSKGYTGSGVLRNSTVPLSRASIPVVFLSTYNIDYILVQESLISKVTKVLEDHSIINNIILEDYVCSALIPPNNKLIVKPYSLHLASINRENMRLCAKELVRLMFYPPENQKFFHFTETEDEVSLLLDSVSYSIIPQELLVTSDTWKQILRYKKKWPV